MFKTMAIWLVTFFLVSASPGSSTALADEHTEAQALAALNAANQLLCDVNAEMASCTNPGYNCVNKLNDCFSLLQYMNPDQAEYCGLYGDCDLVRTALTELGAQSYTGSVYYNYAYTYNVSANGAYSGGHWDSCIANIDEQNYYSQVFSFQGMSGELARWRYIHNTLAGGDTAYGVTAKLEADGLYNYLCELECTIQAALP